MSGTSFGPVVLHVAPETAAGGPLAMVQTGDDIRLDVPNRRVDLMIGASEWEARISRLRPAPRAPVRGYRKMYVEHVTQADEGCDFDFLRAVPVDLNAR
jgi:dihydroxy-acid dehydratase